MPAGGRARSVRVANHLSERLPVLFIGGECPQRGNIIQGQLLVVANDAGHPGRGQFLDVRRMNAQAGQTPRCSTLP